MDLSECLTNGTSFYLTRDRSMKKSIFYKDETPELFIKDFNHAEFVGEELCAIKNIRCAHYFLVGIGMCNLKRIAKHGDIIRGNNHYKYKIASYDFRDSTKKYKHLADYGFQGDNKFEQLLDRAPTIENREELCSDLLDMLALDIYMGQDDRTDRNILLELDHEERIRLAPLYDFEYSLKGNYLGGKVIHGDCDLIDLNDPEFLQEFIEEYPEFREKLSGYLDIDLCKVISRAYTRQGLVIPSDKWHFYQEFDEDRKEVIKKIIK